MTTTPFTRCVCERRGRFARFMTWPYDARVFPDVYRPEKYPREDGRWVSELFFDVTPWMNTDHVVEVYDARDDALRMAHRFAGDHVIRCAWLVLSTTTGSVSSSRVNPPYDNMVRTDGSFRPTRVLVVGTSTSVVEAIQ